MDTQKRTYLAIALMLGLTLVFNTFVWGPESERREAELRAAAADAGLTDGGFVAVDAGAVAIPLAQLDADGGSLPTVAAAAPPAEIPIRTVDFERPSMKMTFTSLGAGLSDAILSGTRERETYKLTLAEGFQKLFGKKFPPGKQMDMAEPAQGQAPQLAVAVLGANPLSPTLKYQVTEQGPGKVVFSGTEGPWQIVKTFTWDPSAKGLANDLKSSERDPHGYQVHLDVTLTNTSPQPVQGELAATLTRSIDVNGEEAASMFGSIGNQASVLCQRTGEKVARHLPGERDGAVLGCGGVVKTDFEEKGQIGYVGIDQQYFLSAIWPSGGAVDGRCTMHASGTARTASLVFPVTVPAGGSISKPFDTYFGPKDLEMLQVVGSAGAAPLKLDETIDFTFWAFICRVLLFFLRFFHGVVGNWGVAVILLTLMVKIALLPLTHKGMVAAEAMKKLQPEMEKIKAKYPDDREKQQMEQMRLYQEAKVNPLGGCLPMLVQIPIWGALFTTLRTSYELYGEPFFGVWSDLTYKDPTYILPLALGITMIVTQRLQPQMMSDPSQAFLITWVMPIFFTVIMLNYPAGLALYIFTNNLLSIGQQFALRKYLERTGKAAPKLNKLTLKKEGKK